VFGTGEPLAGKSGESVAPAMYALPGMSVTMSCTSSYESPPSSVLYLSTGSMTSGVAGSGRAPTVNANVWSSTRR
jgi:hypothetical protein